MQRIFSDIHVKCSRMVKVHLGPDISVRGLMYSQVLQRDLYLYIQYRFNCFVLPVQVKSRSDKNAETKNENRR